MIFDTDKSRIPNRSIMEDEFRACEDKLQAIRYLLLVAAECHELGNPNLKIVQRAAAETNLLTEQLNRLCNNVICDD